MAKFNVGDKVRILDVGKISGGRSNWNNGDVVKVTKVDDGLVWLERTKTEESSFHEFITPREYGLVELISTKKQRITDAEKAIEALELEVAKLKEIVEALEKAVQSPKSVAVTTDNTAVGDKIRVLDANEICGGFDLTNGKIYDVCSVDSGNFYVLNDDSDMLVINPDEFPYVEKVASE